MCIGQMDHQGVEYHCIDSFRLVLAAHLPQLEVRELPVSLLRLYFAGQQHFCTLVDQVSHHSFARLLEMAARDAHDAPCPEAWWARPNEDEPAARVNQKRVLAAYLARVLDAALCSFERTLVMMARADEWPDFGLEEALATDAYWAGVPRPPPPSELVGARHVDMRRRHLVWYACLWRCNVTLQLERLMKPWRAPEHRDWLLYRMQLFRDTHLDLMTVCVARRAYTDVALASESSRLLQLYWPACDRVCCAEELPDLATYALDNLKTGTHLKARNSLRDKLGHILFIKTMNNICKDRNFFDIVVRDGEQDELVYDLVKAIARCVLLGNLPGARGTLCMAARLRCNWSFFPEQADRVMSEEEVQRTMPPYRNPFAMAQAKRDKKRRKEEAKGTKPERIEQLLAALKRKQERGAYEKTCFKMWILKCPYFVASLMKEFLFSVVEAGRCMDELLALDHKWIEYKEIVRIANGRCRQELSRQAALSPLPLDWSIIEHVEKPPDREYDIKRGLIMEFHALALRVAKKVMKRDFMGIMEVKATGTEEEIVNFQRQEAAIVYLVNVDDDDSDAVGPQMQTVTLEELHFVCWYMAQQLQRGSGVLETRWFQPLGMSRDGLTHLRKLLFRYYTFDIADDSLKDEIRAFRKRSLQDYLLMKTVFKLIAYYRRKERLFFLPVEVAVRQAHALRTHQLRISEWEATPELLGVAYQCHGCLKFANAVVQPLEFTVQSNYAELVRRKNQIHSELHPRPTHPQINGSTCHNLVLTHSDRRTRVLEHCKTQVARVGAPKNERKNARGDPDFDEEKHNEELEEEEQRRRRENISFLNVAFYNVQDGQPHCVRSRRQRVIVSRECTGQANVIMTSLRRPTRIESTRFTTRTINESASPGETTQRRQHSADDDDDGPDDESTGEGEDFRPQYENNPLLFNPSVATLRREGREYLQQWFAGQTNTVVGGDPTQPTVAPQIDSKKTRYVENNKKRILRLVTEPLSRMHNCQRALQPVDMVGVVKNGHVLCVECGVMTLLSGHSMTAQGPVCMRHANVAFTLNHPVWQMDSQSTSFLVRSQAYDAPPDLLSNASGKHTPSKRRPHPSDVMNPAVASFHQCECCQTEHPAVSVPCYDDHFHTRKVMCCVRCYRKLRPLLQKHYILSQRQLACAK